jgi:IclR family pca regulon transcriptional regulator
MVNVGPGIRSHLPAWCYATGRMLLGGLTAEEREVRLAGMEFRPITARPATDPVELRQSIAAAARDGYPPCDEELKLGLRSLALPVGDVSGAVVAAMSVGSQPGRRAAGAMLRELLPALCEAAAHLSAAG